MATEFPESERASFFRVGLCDPNYEGAKGILRLELAKARCVYSSRRKPFQWGDYIEAGRLRPLNRIARGASQDLR
jgi:hypothetical protein